ncbi:hypothetical protein [Algibacter sp. 2305UL17-15]|uniref:hypothetical protein n=1 Tax=Algibacter sp. 2305UL17-15 TaxID=3231268 RepID=UPI003458BF96
MIYEKPIDRFCAVFGHNLRHITNIDEETSELVCKSCQNHFISTNSGNILNLSVHRETHTISDYLNQKRIPKLSKVIGF